MDVRLSLLGRAQVWHLGGWLELPRDMRGGLLVYLALAPASVTRERLAFLFWPDEPERVARQNLRQLLRRVKRLAYAGALELSDQSVAWKVASDAQAFRARLAANEQAAALELYRGPLLPDFALGADEFSAWLTLEREALAHMHLTAVMARASALAERGAPGEAARLVEPFIWQDDVEAAESALQSYLRFALAAGDTGAERIYQRWKEHLRRELGAAPLPATVKLALALAEPRPKPAPLQGRLHALPRFTTPFVGRDLELAALLTTLTTSECCLLTLIGPGGIGKTRLAVEAARLAADSFEHGSLFVALEAVTEVQLVPATIAAALELPLQGGEPPEQRLLAFLQDKELLLVLDNFEQLLPEGGLLARLIGSCSRLTLLVTSRERLHLSGECLFEVGGLSIPEHAEDDALERFDAVQLFVRAVRRARPGFSLHEGNRREVLAICRQVEGTPLALELAASWLRALSSREVAEALRSDLDLLAQEMSDLPERQRSLRRLFEHSWGLLSPEQQGALARLSVFRGGFEREAAEAALGVATRTLLALYDKSLLKRQGRERFALHELVRQYAAEKLAEDPSVAAAAAEGHARVYCAFVAAHEPFKQGMRQAHAVAAINDELANLRAAWRWAGERRRLELLALATDGLWQFYEIRCLFAEGEEAFRLAAKRIGPTGDSAARALLLAHLGALSHRIGKLEPCEKVSRESLAMSARLGLPPVWTATYNLALLPFFAGDVREAQRRHEEALETGRQYRDDLLIASALNGLGIVARMQGDLEGAERYFRQSLDSFSRQDNSWLRAIACSNLGILYLKRQDYSKADRFLRRTLALASSLEQRAVACLARLHLGRLALWQGEARAAQEHLEAGLQLASALDYRDNVEIAWVLLAQLAAQQGRRHEARALFQRALESALSRSAFVCALDTVVAAAASCADAGDGETALELLAFALAQPELHLPCDPDLDLGSKEIAQKLYQRLASALGSRATEEAGKRAANLSYEGLWQQLEEAVRD